MTYRFCCAKINYQMIEAHFTKITAHKRLPEPCGKGVSAEVGAVAKRLAGSSENIRPVVV